MRRYDIYFEDGRCDRRLPLPLIPPPRAAWAVGTAGAPEVLMVIEERWLDIRIARSELGWSIAELARRCAVATETARQWEAGAVPTADQRRRLLVLFDAPNKQKMHP
jgi:hypothetical protein